VMERTSRKPNEPIHMQMPGLPHVGTISVMFYHIRGPNQDRIPISFQGVEVHRMNTLPSNVSQQVSTQAFNGRPSLSCLAGYLGSTLSNSIVSRRTDSRIGTARTEFSPQRRSMPNGPRESLSPRSSSVIEPKVSTSVLIRLRNS
jgi:hypothetical protein